MNVMRILPYRVMVMSLFSVGLVRCETVPPEPSAVPPSAGEPALPVTGPSVFVPIPETEIHTPPSSVMESTPVKPPQPKVTKKKSQKAPPPPPAHH